MASSREGLSGFVDDFGGFQKELHVGSNMPAPGTTTSMFGHSVSPLLNRADSCGQDVTSVFWNIAEGLVVEGELGYCLSNSWASGLKFKSPIKTEQPR